MVMKRVQIKKNNSLSGDNGTDVFSIGRGMAISNLFLRFRAKNGADHNVTGTGALAESVVEALEEIKVYSGSRTFKNYDAEVCRAFATYKNGRNPYFNQTQVAGGAYPTGWQEIYLPISFNRFPGDRQCALPAPLMPSLEMSITYDFDVLDGNGDTAFLTGSANHKYDLFADVIPGLHETSLQGLQIIEETKKQDRTTLASGDDKIDMTISPDKQLRQVLAHVYKAGEVEGSVVTDVGLKVDQTEYFTDSWRGLQAQNAEDCRLEYVQDVLTKANTTTDEVWTRIPEVNAYLTPRMITTAGHEGPFVANSGDKVTLTTEAADDLNMLRYTSPVIPATAIIDFDKALNMQDLLNMGVKDLDFTYTNGTADGKLRLYEQVIATY